MFMLQLENKKTEKGERERGGIRVYMISLIYHACVNNNTKQKCTHWSMDHGWRHIVYSTLLKSTIMMSAWQAKARANPCWHGSYNWRSMPHASSFQLMRTSNITDRYCGTLSSARVATRMHAQTQDAPGTLTAVLFGLGEGGRDVSTWQWIQLRKH